MNNLFVYGTLKSKLQSQRLGSGKIKGKLFDLGFYPGAVEDKESYIHGEIYLIDTKTLKLLDKYEGTQSGLFVRKRTTAFMKDGREIEVLVYFYNGNLVNAIEIQSGNWMMVRK